MATGGADPNVGAVDPDMNDVYRMMDLFKHMNLKPNLESPESFQNWMTNYVQATSMDEHDSTVPHDDHEDSIHFDQQGTAYDHQSYGHNYQQPLSNPQLMQINNFQAPRISNFSGNQDCKTEKSFDEWKFEIQCLLAEGQHSHATILRAIRHSLRGEASKIAMRLGPNVSVTTLMTKFEGVFGTVERGESLLAEFYSASQGEHEDVVTWGCRLEELLDRARKRGQVQPHAMDEMLRTKFWLGLKPSLKNISSHKFDTCMSFDTLRVQLRIIEHEMALQGNIHSHSSKKPVPGKAAVNVKPTTDKQGSTTEKENQGLADVVEKLSKQVCQLQKQIEKQKEPKPSQPPQMVTSTAPELSVQEGQSSQWSQDYLNYQQPPTAFWTRNQGRQTRYWQPQQTISFRQAVPSFPRPPQPNRGRWTTRQGSRHYNPADSMDRSSSYNQYHQQANHGGIYSTDEVVCWRCGQVGHVQYGCRVNLEHMRQPLN